MATFLSTYPCTCPLRSSVLIDHRVDLPNLSQVRGAFNLQTSGEFDCKPFDDAKKKKGIIKGKYTCRGSLTKPGGAGTKPSDTNNGAKESSPAMAIGVNMPAVVGGTSFVAGLMQLIL